MFGWLFLRGGEFSYLDDPREKEEIFVLVFVTPRPRLAQRSVSTMSG
jgi:hypothetical protein